MSFPSSGSLFGGPLGGSSAPQSTNPAGSGLFASSSASQPPSNSLFGSQSQTQQQQPTQSSLFDQTSGQASGGQEPSRPAGQTQPAFFNSLLERGKKRSVSEVGQNSTFDELPNLQLGLDDIRRRARELGAGGTRDSPQHGVNIKA